MLAENGYSVIACARREQELLDLQSINSSIIPFRMDITSPTDVEKLNDFIGDKVVDISINCAGGNNFKRADLFEESSFLEMNELFLKNASGNFNLIKSISKKMSGADAPIVIVFTAMSGHNFDPQLGSYSIAKKAESMMTKYMRDSLSGKLIRVTEVVVSNVDSGHLNSNLPKNSMTLNDINYVIKSIIGAPNRLNFDTIYITDVENPPRI